MKWYSPVSYTGMFLSLVVGILKSYRSYRLFSLLLGLLLPSWSWLQYHCMKQGETWLILQLNSNSLKLTKPRYKLNHFKDPCHWWPCLIFICYYWSFSTLSLFSVTVLCFIFSFIALNVSVIVFNLWNVCFTGARSKGSHTLVLNLVPHAWYLWHGTYMFCI